MTLRKPLIVLTKSGVIYSMSKNSHFDTTNIKQNCNAKQIILINFIYYFSIMKRKAIKKYYIKKFTKCFVV